LWFLAIRAIGGAVVVIFGGWIMVAKKVAEFAQLKIRVTDKLRRDLEREAKKNHRSANSEATERLEKSFEADATRHWDTFMTAMVGGDKNSDLLQWLATKMSREWNWDSAEARQRMVKDIQDELDARSVQ
jgi:hypothetical protein